MSDLERFLNEPDLFDADPLIKMALMDYKHRIRDQHKFYSQDLINNLFSHPYTKIEFLQRDLKVSRMTATRYLRCAERHRLFGQTKDRTRKLLRECSTE